MEGGRPVTVRLERACASDEQLRLQQARARKRGAEVPRFASTLDLSALAKVVRASSPRSEGAPSISSSSDSLSPEGSSSPSHVSSGSLSASGSNSFSEGGFGSHPAGGSRESIIHSGPVTQRPREAPVPRRRSEGDAALARAVRPVMGRRPSLGSEAPLARATPTDSDWSLVGSSESSLSSLGSSAEASPSPGVLVAVEGAVDQYGGSSAFASVPPLGSQAFGSGAVGAGSGGAELSVPSELSAGGHAVVGSHRSGASSRAAMGGTAVENNKIVGSMTSGGTDQLAGQNAPLGHNKPLGQDGSGGRDGAVGEASLRCNAAVAGASVGTGPSSGGGASSLGGKGTTPTLVPTMNIAKDLPAASNMLARASEASTADGATADEELRAQVLALAARWASRDGAPKTPTAASVSQEQLLAFMRAMAGLEETSPGESLSTVLTSDESRAGLSKAPPPPRTSKKGGPPMPASMKKGGPPMPASMKKGGPPMPASMKKGGAPSMKKGGPPMPASMKKGGPPMPASMKKGGPPMPASMKKGGPPMPANMKKGPPMPGNMKKGGPPRKGGPVAKAAGIEIAEGLIPEVPAELEPKAGVLWGAASGAGAASVFRDLLSKPREISVIEVDFARVASAFCKARVAPVTRARSVAAPRVSSQLLDPQVWQNLAITLKKYKVAGNEDALIKYLLDYSRPTPEGLTWDLPLWSGLLTAWPAEWKPLKEPMPFEDRLLERLKGLGPDCKQHILFAAEQPAIEEDASLKEAALSAYLGALARAADAVASEDFRALAQLALRLGNYLNKKRVASFKFRDWYSSFSKCQGEGVTLFGFLVTTAVEAKPNLPTVLAPLGALKAFEKTDVDALLNLKLLESKVGAWAGRTLQGTLAEHVKTWTGTLQTRIAAMKECADKVRVEQTRLAELLQLGRTETAWPLPCRWLHEFHHYFAKECGARVERAAKQQRAAKKAGKAKRSARTAVTGLEGRRLQRRNSDFAGWATPGIAHGGKWNAPDRSYRPRRKDKADLEKGLDKQCTPSGQNSVQKKSPGRDAAHLGGGPEMVQSQAGPSTKQSPMNSSLPRPGLLPLEMTLAAPSNHVHDPSARTGIGAMLPPSDAARDLHLVAAGLQPDAATPVRPAPDCDLMRSDQFDLDQFGI